MLQLYRPVKPKWITQKFGQNLAGDLYASLGLLGHNGLDFGCAISPIMFNANVRGEVLEVEDHPTYGKKIVTITRHKSGKCYLHYNGHLSVLGVREGQMVETGQPIGVSGDTGKYCYGAHLHYGLYPCDKYGNKTDKGNGYGGAIDPMQFYNDIYAEDLMTYYGQIILLYKQMIGLLKK